MFNFFCISMFVSETRARYTSNIRDSPASKAKATSEISCLSRNKLLSEFKIPKKHSSETSQSEAVPAELPSQKLIPFQTMKLNDLEDTLISTEMEQISLGADYSHLLMQRQKSKLVEEDYLAIAKACIMLEECCEMNQLGQKDSIPVSLQRTDNEDVFKTKIFVSIKKFYQSSQSLRILRKFFVGCKKACTFSLL